MCLSHLWKSQTHKAFNSAPFSELGKVQENCRKRFRECFSHVIQKVSVAIHIGETLCSFVICVYCTYLKHLTFQMVFSDTVHRFNTEFFKTFCYILRALESGGYGEIAKVAQRVFQPHFRGCYTHIHGWNPIFCHHRLGQVIFFGY